jgi:hypothetical protein
MENSVFGPDYFGPDSDDAKNDLAEQIENMRPFVLSQEKKKHFDETSFSFFSAGELDVERYKYWFNYFDKVIYQKYERDKELFFSWWDEWFSKKENAPSMFGNFTGKHQYFISFLSVAHENMSHKLYEDAKNHTVDSEFQRVNFEDSHPLRVQTFQQTYYNLFLVHRDKFFDYPKKLRKGNAPPSDLCSVGDAVVSRVIAEPLISLSEKYFACQQTGRDPYYRFHEYSLLISVFVTSWLLSPQRAKSEVRFENAYVVMFPNPNQWFIDESREYLEDMD